ncbi:hypothetical protein ACLOJK_021629 [Asimina triloba]
MYHLTRTDPRHNFSIYFYHIYLHHEEGFSVIEKLISFLPQLMVQLIVSLSFAQDIPFCLFVQTVAFVAFNKVITAQYFFVLGDNPEFLGRWPGSFGNVGGEQAGGEQLLEVRSQTWCLLCFRAAPRPARIYKPLRFRIAIEQGPENEGFGAGQQKILLAC